MDAKKSKQSWKIALVATFLVFSAAGCAKNVERINFTKWGNSSLPAGRNGVDTTAQGGSSLGNTAVPANANNAMPKSSVGGTYQRTKSQSANYIMTGGFHVNSAQ